MVKPQRDHLPTFKAATHAFSFRIAPPRKERRPISSRPRRSIR